VVPVVERAAGTSSEDLSEILAALSEVVSSPEVAGAGPRDTLADLGVDSLGLIQFVAALEHRLGIRFSHSELESLGTATLREMAQLVSAARSVGDSGGVRADATRSGARPPEPRLGITVRGFREADRGTLRRICIEESNLGTLNNLSPVFFLDQYCDDDPSSCFVAEFDGEVVGYCVGTLDTDRLRRGYATYMMRRAREILGSYRRAWPGLSWREHRWLWRQLLLERSPSRHSAYIVRQLGQLFGKTYAHFQLDQGKAPAGTVFALAHAWLEHLRSHGIQGAMLASVPGGPPAVDMWKRLGFAPLEVTQPNGSRVTWLLAIL
jgi:acyl carrier protein